ncbi:hypothetical protein HPO96_02925 [Kribbella sandramycini]|uniref:TrbL/VirB6 plasmid conjugal transfer protein n=1 Tax=Kribbella sandramycini TaxID=60450 RepID=A0A7Y4KV88_9ACTN|nr:hypothetical protein [Kribbella sandramycini]MBB6568216.1 hypothetical protein [Kribbella sandramycini]NOL39190.1 hypothetical protein [Kribbella sandramycini]
MKWQRRARAALTVLVIWTIVSSQIALAADPDQGPTNPTGFADLLPTPDLTHGDTRTLFEQYSPMDYGLDFDTGLSNTFNMIFNGYASIVMMYVLAITRAAISVGWWLFSFTDVKPLTDATSATIGATGTQLAGWLLPSALAFGAVVAYTQRRATGSAMGQLVWVFVAGLLSVSFAVAPATWLRGVDGARQLGAGAVMTASSDALGPTSQSPIPWPEPGFTGTPRDTLLRKSADASWRGFAVTPWCIAEFGSISACERYGKGMLTAGVSHDARNDYVDRVIAPAEGGNDSPTVQWIKGENPFGRVAVVMIAAIVATLFGFLNIGLAFTALMAFIGALLLLVVGVFFACLWIIPGRPRQWGMNWFEALVGLVLQSFLAMLVFGTALTLVTAVFTLSGPLGWLPVTGLAIVVLLVGFRLRRLLDNLTTMMRPGSGSIMLGGMARRGATTAIRRLAGMLGSRGTSPQPAERTRDRRSGAESAPQRVSSVRVYRQAPVVGSLGRGSGSSPYELTSGAGRRGDGTAGGGQDGPGAGGRLAAAAAPGAPTSALNLARSRNQNKSEGRRTISVTTAGVASTGAASSSGGSRSSADAPKARHSRRSVSAPASESRFEPRIHSSSASLREGPPKAQRVRRKSPGSQQRTFREYSAVTKDGVTVHVPTRR